MAEEKENNVNEQTIQEPSEESNTPIYENGGSKDVKEDDEKGSEAEQRTYTDDDVDKIIAKKLAIRDRYWNKREKAGQVVATEQAPTQAGNQQGYIQDPFLGSIPADISVSDYQKMLLSAAQGGQQQNSADVYQQPVAAAPYSAPQHNAAGVSHGKPNIQLSHEAKTQIENCCSHNDDGEAMIFSSSVTDVMANYAASDPNGIDNLYRLQKENPQRVLEISRMPLMKQAEAMWQLNQEMANRRKKKIKSNATPQPAPLEEGESAVQKPYAELSFEQKKALRRKRGL